MKKRLIALTLACVLCLALFAACGTKDSTEDSDLAYVTENGKLVIGITPNEPMNYYDEDGELVGFDTEFALAVCEKLGLEAEFVFINWDSKEEELEAKSIDAVWNGMTITQERSETMSISYPYLYNAQAIVVQSGSSIASTADLIGKTVVAEAGSAGEEMVADEEYGDENLLQATYIAMSRQLDCLLEVKAGSADAAVIDFTMARATTGEGSDYSDLTYLENALLGEEEYGIAFRKGSDITAKVNEIIEALAADGTLTALAEKYSVTLSDTLLAMSK